MLAELTFEQMLPYYMILAVSVCAAIFAWCITGSGSPDRQLKKIAQEQKRMAKELNDYFAIYNRDFAVLKGEYDALVAEYERCVELLDTKCTGVYMTEDGTSYVTMPEKWYISVAEYLEELGVRDFEEEEEECDVRCA
jgi:hypothetical protein